MLDSLRPSRESPGSRPPSTGTEVERLIGLDAIQSRFEELAPQSRTECLSIMPGGGRRPEILATDRRLNADALARGVSIRTLCQDGVRTHGATFRYAQWLTARGGEVRTAPSLPTMMIIIDRTSALVPVDPDDLGKGALHVASPGIVAPLVSLFEHVWATATPLDASRRPDSGTGLTGLERELVRLLAYGHTDEIAARKLGISTRTVRRMMASLMKRLASSSRFQAGARAAQHGWL